MRKGIAILGSGPSSMFITMACNEHGFVPAIFGKRSVHAPAGAFYYHWLPEMYCNDVPLEDIEYFYLGNSRTYSEKQWDGRIYPSSFGSYHDELGYDPAKTHAEFLRKSEAVYIDAGILGDLDIYRICEMYCVVFCTFPNKQAYEMVRKVKRPVTVEDCDANKNRIIYNGLADVAWVRISELFGKRYTEYCKMEDVPENTKFVTIDDLHPDTEIPKIDKPFNLHYVGRYAEMNRRLLSHSAYFKTLEVLNVK